MSVAPASGIRWPRVCAPAVHGARSGSWILLLLVWLVPPLHAQTIDDGIMMGRHSLFAGNVYTHDSWNLYWEGALKRDNENVGTITTQSNLLFGNYGVTDRLNVIAAAPYVWTRASQGVLSGMEGFQDITSAGLW